jgi:hypothetical protein
MSNEVARRGMLGKKGLIGIASLILAIGIAYFALDLRHEPIKKAAVASANPADENHTRTRPVRAMNMALGNMVYFAQDLGFTVKTAKGETYDAGKIVLRIENQLQSLRQVYRQESAKKPFLVGGIMLEFVVGPSGEVTRVKDTSSLIKDTDFRIAVVTEVGKWNFADLVSEPLVVACPLLFVHEGMDITTLIQWEKALGHFDDKGTPVRAAAGTKPVIKSGTIVATAPAAKPMKETPAQPKNVTAEIKIFQIKYPTSLRKDPNFSSTSLMTFTSGTKVILINGRGDWLEVKAIDNDLSGFIRKEFVTPFDVVGK